MSLTEDLELLEELREEGSRLEEANLLYRIGATYIKKGESEEAIAAFQAAYGICLVENNDQGRLDVVRQVVPLLVELGKLEEAEAGVAAGFELAEKMENLSVRLDFMELESRLFLAQDKPRQAVENLIRAADICGDNEDWIGRFIMLEKAAPLLRRSGRYKNALKIYTELTELALRANDQGRLALALAGQGQMLESLGHPDAALKALTSALEVYKIIGHKRYLELISAEVERLKQKLTAGQQKA